MSTRLPLFLLATIILSVATFAQTITLTAPPNGSNQKSSVTQWIGLVSVTVTYHGPDVHDNTGADRKGHIWGELVHYGMQDPDGFGTSTASPWRTGSNEITTVSVSHDVKINGKDLKAGTYGLFLLLDRDKPWTWIFSKNAASWGGYYYTPNEDVLRVEATPEDSPYTEWLTFGFDDRQLLSALAYLQWENKRITFKVEVPQGKQLYADQMRAELTGYAGFNPENWQRCAQFCLTNNTNLEQGLQWIDIAMNSTRFNGQKTFRAMQIKADILGALNKAAESEAVMTEAIATLNPTVQDLHQYGRTLLGAGKNDKALEIFKLNKQRHKDDNFTTFVGLARVYTALDNKKEAIKNWEVAIKNIPQNQLQNKGLYEEELKKLKG